MIPCIKCNRLLCYLRLCLIVTVQVAADCLLSCLKFVILLLLLPLLVSRMYFSVEYDFGLMLFLKIDYSIVQSPYSENDSRSAVQYISRLSWNSKVRSQDAATRPCLASVHTVSPYFSNNNNHNYCFT